MAAAQCRRSGGPDGGRAAPDGWDGAAPAPSDAEPLLAAAGQALSSLPAGTVPSTVEYSGGELRLRGLPTDGFDAFRQKLQAQGLQAQMQNDQWVIRAQAQP